MALPGGAPSDDVPLRPNSMPRENCLESLFVPNCSFRVAIYCHLQHRTLSLRMLLPNKVLSRRHNDRIWHIAIPINRRANSFWWKTRCRGYLNRPMRDGPLEHQFGIWHPNCVGSCSLRRIVARVLNSVHDTNPPKRPPETTNRSES